MAEGEDRWDGYVGPKIWVPALFIVAIALIAMGVILVMNSDDDGEPGGVIENPDGSLRQPTHEHADFALFVNGELYDFNQPQYLTTEDEEVSTTVHIHPPRINIVHVHYEQTTWSEFFDTLGFELRDTSLTLPDGTVLENNDTETLKFFVNGVQIDSLFLNYITDLDRVLISFGPETADEVRETQLPTVTDEACIVSGLCQDRIDPNEPEEPCQGQGQCS